MVIQITGTDYMQKEKEKEKGTDCKPTMQV
jgi:hypothetical protein